MAKISREEYEILKSLDDQWKWIARDEKETHESFYSNQVMAYRTRPNKHNWLNIWSDGSGGKRLPEELFQFIQWEDEEPYSIYELIEEYLDDEYGYFNMKLSREFEEFVEIEREEAGVKDLEWAMEEIEKERNLLNDRRYEREVDDLTTGVLMGLKKALKILDQLDEPRELPVIPQFVAEWIEEMKQDERPLYSVMSTLMNKTNHEWAVWKSANKNFSEIVAQVWLNGFTAEEEPKQELPVIPQHVASYLNIAKREITLMRSLEIANRRRELPKWEKEYDWIEANHELFARAWLDGYEVEEEQKFYALIKGHENISSDDKYWNYCITDESLDIGDNKVHADVLIEYVLSATKDEWENIGINDDNADFVEVEGM